MWAVHLLMKMSGEFHPLPVVTSVHLNACGIRELTFSRNSPSHRCPEMLTCLFIFSVQSFQVALVVKNPPANAGDLRHGFDSWVGKIPWRRAWQPTPVFLPGESHGQRSLEGYSPWSHKESDTTEVTSHACIFSVCLFVCLCCVLVVACKIFSCGM